MARGRIWSSLGPGLLFAAAAIGVSHLVQSTRAGAYYGLGLVPVVVLANMMKYPAFLFGPHYAAATGTSLLEGYRRQGRWALVLYALLTFGTMFTVVSAIVVVTAGLAKVVFRLPFPIPLLSVGVLALCVGLTATGYRWLNRINKWIVVSLALITIVATLLVIGRLPVAAPHFFSIPTESMNWVFLAALIGWMPSAIDVSVWQSLWTLSKGGADRKDALTRATTDFHVGYVGTALLALCFMVLGAGLMFGRGTAPAAGAGAFASQLIDLYGAALGLWSRPIIGICALLTMFSTALVVTDGFPRVLAVLWLRVRGPEQENDPIVRAVDRTRAFWVSLAILVGGSVLVVFAFLGEMRRLVDVATVLSFLSAPLLSWLNHRAVFGPHVLEVQRPAEWLRKASWVGIALQLAFSLGFLLLRLLT